MPMEFQFHQRVVQGHARNFLKHSITCSFSGDIFGSSLDRSTMLALSPPPPPLSPLAFAAHSPLALVALSSLQPCSSPNPPLPAWWWWWGCDYWHADSFPANLKIVDADPSSPATTTSRTPQATSRRGSGPSDHHVINYFIRDRG
jgi:hypothetical protein